MRDKWPGMVNGICITFMAFILGWDVDDWQFWAWVVVLLVWSVNLLFAREY